MRALSAPDCSGGDSQAGRPRKLATFLTVWLAALEFNLGTPSASLPRQEVGAMFPDPSLAVPNAIPQMTLTVLPALLAGPGAIAIVVGGAVAIAAVAAIARKARTWMGASMKSGLPSARAALPNAR
jgi:hypothetical protein